MRSKSFVKDIVYVAPGARLAHANTNDLGTSVLESKNPSAGTIQNQWQNEMLGIQRMHWMGYAGKGIYIAVFDTGFRGVNTLNAFTHLHIERRLVDAKNFVSSSTIYTKDVHGTQVLSCLAAFEEDNYIGSAHAASYALYVVEDTQDEYRIEEYNWLVAAERADSLGVDIISSALNFSIFDDDNMNYGHKILDGQSSVISQAAKLASARGMLVVQSVGNEGTNDWQYIEVPSDVKDVLSVGGVDRDKNTWASSGKGLRIKNYIKPDIMALGLGNRVLSSDGKVYEIRGTSYAAPLIAGLAAGLMQYYPSKASQAIKKLILDAGDQAHMPNIQRGHGIPHFKRIVQQTIDNDAAPSKVYPNPLRSDKVSLGGDLYVLLSDAYAQCAYVDFLLVNANGEIVKQFREFNILTRTVVIHMKHLPKGYYVLHIKGAKSAQHAYTIKESRKILYYE